ncbi:hypothetical protein HYALB_00010980 [Hymenoscyphus albidus]|uniref:AA9 family lytic polysaccharide monooxygenase n=1 Tax=Hymenoscyphus albidus TaxID=595503 RepID=A0A9N9Q7A2_9HELO|nr:hypothetical protein HYALB_00010980 [Hymenoscyphus albidus]
MRYSLHLVGLLAVATTVVGHSTFQDLWVDSKDEATNCTRIPLSNSPIGSVTTNDIRCNKDVKAAASTCTVPAGSKITVEMHAQPNDRACSHEALGGNHFGPVMIYMSKVSSAVTDPGSGDWFKISEEGYNPTTKKWGTDSLNANCGKRDAVVPASIAPGDYLIRAEAIALHAASSVGGAQPYVTCYQVTVTGSGTVTPPGVKFPGAYKPTDPGIQVNIYNNLKEYIIPGPPVFTG